VLLAGTGLWMAFPEGNADNAFQGAILFRRYPLLDPAN